MFTWTAAIVEIFFNSTDFRIVYQFSRLGFCNLIGVSEMEKFSSSICFTRTRNSIDFRSVFRSVPILLTGRPSSNVTFDKIFPKNCRVSLVGSVKIVTPYQS